MRPGCQIHPSAVVLPEAQLGEGVSVGPFAIIEGPVRIGAGCRVRGHAQLVGDVVIGERCRIGRGSILGEAPQAIGFDPSTESGVRLGSDNVLGENVTIHRSASDGGITSIGDGNRFGIGAHLGHDVVAGSRNTFEERCMVAGHVEIGDGVRIGSRAGIHQFVRLGDGCQIAEGSAITQDIPPFIGVSGANHFEGIYRQGLADSGHDVEACAEIERVFAVLFGEQKPLREAIEAASAMSWGAEAALVIDFVANSGRKGMMVPRLA